MDVREPQPGPELPSEHHPQSTDTLALVLRVLGTLTLAAGIGGYFTADGASDVTRLGYLLAGVLLFALCLGSSFVAKRWRR